MQVKDELLPPNNCQRLGYLVAESGFANKHRMHLLQQGAQAALLATTSLAGECTV
jgi:hypothetical protein